MRVGLVNYEMGNLASVRNAFERIGVNIELISSPKALKECDKIVLPGVGAFPAAMEALTKSGLKDAILEFASSKKPILGICLGMQLLFERSYEFKKCDGLGLIEGEVVPFEKKRLDSGLKIPQMGWNKLFIRQSSKLFEGMPEAFYLYFVHSYHAVCDEKYIIGESYYGYSFASAVQKENIFGFQPHPEKSHQNGLKILQNFLKV